MYVYLNTMIVEESNVHANKVRVLNAASLALQRIRELETL